MKIVLKTVGSDPEFFIRRKRDGIFVPSSIITTGTKNEPLPINDKGFFIHKDNLAIEGNIPPATNKEEFITSMKFLKDVINTFAEIKGCELVSEDEVEFKKRFLNTEDANDFGCSSYKNAWVYHNSEISTPKLSHSNTRVAGFHIHLGYDLEDCNYDKIDIAKAIGRAFDLFLTLPSDNIKYSKFRRNFYGVYGSIRETSYGVECRTLGSYFTKDEYLGWVYDQIEKMFVWLNTDDNIAKILLNDLHYIPNNYNMQKVKKKFKIEEEVKCLT